MNVTGSRKGFTLISALMVGTILSVLSLGVVKTTSLMARAGIQSNTTLSIEMVRRNLMAHLNDSAAWELTVNDTHNTSLDCLRNKTDCTNRGGDIRLRDRANRVVYDGTSPTSGFSANGAQSCDSFNGVSGNDVCPFHLKLEWIPLCTGYCVSPQVEVRGTFVYKPLTEGRRLAFNQANYGFTVTLQRPGNVLQMIADEQAVQPVTLAPAIWPAGPILTISPRSVSSKLLVECTFQAEKETLPFLPAEPPSFMIYETTSGLNRVSGIHEVMGSHPDQLYLPLTIRALVANSSLTPRTFRMYFRSPTAPVLTRAIICSVMEMSG